MAIKNYWYDKQLRSYLLQFCAIFQGLSVATGKGADGNITMLPVPTIVGNRDRVVAAIQAMNTQNIPMSLPTSSAWFQGLELAPERRKGIGTVDRRTFLPANGVFPTDLKTVERIMPVPYNMLFELSLYASNSDQLQQMLEQICLIFDPILQIQTTDAPFDWTKITYVELTGINNEENYPIGQDRRMVVWSLNFTMPIWISGPMNFKSNYISGINVRIANLDSLTVNEVNAEGYIIPTADIWGDNLVIAPTP